MRKLFSMIVCLSLLASSFQLEALTAGDRLKWAFATALATFGGAWVINEGDNSPMARPWERERNGDLKYPEKIKVAAIPSAIVGLTSFWITAHYSPEYRYSWANKKRNELSRKILFSYEVTSKNLKEISIASGAETSGMPLVSMFLELSQMDKKVSSLISELEIAQRDVTSSSHLYIRISDLIDHLHTDRLRIRQSEHAVKNSDPTAWQEQWRLYNESKLREREIQAQMAMASRPHVHYGVNCHI